MKKTFILFTLALLIVCLSNAQNLNIPIDTVVVTNHTTTIKNVKIPYTATAGTLPLWDENGKPVATLFYVYYKRSDISDMAKRPLLISFNGGPGSASVWMHIGYTGPKVLKIDDEGYPIQPFGITDNPNSILDVADIVFVDPVNTGYSRTINASGESANRDKFFGFGVDVEYLAKWLNSFVSRYNRWLSPKYLIGESYGGIRVAGLVSELQNNQWMYINGVIFVSPSSFNPYEYNTPISNVLDLPYFAATAWYHKMLPETLQNKDLIEILPEVEDFALNTLLPALAKGSLLSTDEKQIIADKVSYYSGIAKKSVLQHNLTMPTGFFWKELLRDKSGYTIGRLDSRYLGIDKIEAGNYPQYSPELTSWCHSFTPAINYYLREHLKFETDIKYNIFGDVQPWDYWDEQTFNVLNNLHTAMAENPYLHLFFQSGYYDGATTYFSAKYNMWQIDPSGKMKDRMYFKGYRSGHMMYLRHEDLKTANDDLREFMQKSTPVKKSAKY